MNTFIFLRTSLLGTLAVLASVATGTADDTVFFEPLELDAPAATIAVSEDGAWLFSAHEADDEVLVWSVPTGARAAVIETDSPRALLHRQGVLYVGSFDAGHVRAFAEKEDWDLEDEFRLPGKLRVHNLSAPRGKDFQRILLVNAAGEKGSVGFVLDVRRGQHRPAVLKDAAYVDAVGKQVAIYGDNFYGPGNVTFSQLYSELLAGEEHSPARSRDHCHFIPGYDGLHWFGSGFVWTGYPPEAVHEEDQGTVIPDLGRNLYYSLKDGVLTARILSGSLPEVGHVSYEFSPEFQGGSLLYDHRTLRFYQPVADEGFRIDFPGKPNRHVLRGRRPAGDEGFLAGFFGQPSRQQETDGEGNESIGYGYLHPEPPAAYLVAITKLGDAAGADPDAMLAPEDAGAAHIARFLDSFQLTGAMAQKGGSASHRTWTDATGNFSVEAELVKAVGDSVVLPTTDGAERTVALARLSAADRQYVQDRDSGNPAVVAQLEKRLKIIGLAQHDHMFKYKLEYAADSPHNRPLLAKMPQVFATPAMRTSDLTNERLKELVTIADGKPDSPD